MEKPAPGQPAGRKAARPLLVTLVAILVLSITVLAALRLYLALSLWSFLASLPGVSPLYLALSGTIWAVTGVVIILGLWTGNPLAPRATRIAVVLFVLYHWTERWYLSTRNGEKAFTPFAIGFTLLGLAFIFLALAAPEARAFFGDRYE